MRESSYRRGASDQSEGPGFGCQVSGFRCRSSQTAAGIIQQVLHDLLGPFSVRRAADGVDGNRPFTVPELVEAVGNFPHRRADRQQVQVTKVAVRMDAEIVVGILKKDLKDITGFRDAIVSFLKSEKAQ